MLYITTALAVQPRGRTIRDFANTADLPKP